MNEYDLSRAFQRIENDLIDSMMRNLKRHRAEEDELGIKWEQWQALQLKELERYRAKNRDKFAGEFVDINQRISDMLTDTYNTAQTEEEARVLDKIRKGDFRPIQTKDTTFFNLNDDKLNILLERTKADFTRAEYAVLRKADDAYRKVIFDAQVYANVTNDYKRATKMAVKDFTADQVKRDADMYTAQGLTYEQAVDKATHDLLKGGLRPIVYKNGARHSISDYAEMAIKTTNKRAYLMGEGNARDSYGIHTVRVNKRTQACPLCVGYLGKVLIDDVYGGGTAKEASEMGVPTLSSAMQAGFLHPNCKDIYSTYIDGVSRPTTPWTQEEIDEIVGDYNKEQAIQHAVDMQASYARMAKYALDSDNQAKYQARADQWQTRVDELQGGAPVAPKPKEADNVTVLREKLAEAEKEYDKAKALERQWTSDKDNYLLYQSMARIRKRDLTEYLADELRSAEEDFARDPHDINKRSLERIKRVIANREEIEKGDKLKQLRAEVKARQRAIDQIKAELNTELERIDQLSRKEPTFDRNTVVWSKVGELLKNNMTKRGVEYREVRLLDKELTETEIIEKLAGGDMTKGSCMSLAQAYSANKCGLDVTDFRGGASQEVMSYASRNIMNLDGLTPMVEQGETIRPAKALLKKVEEGKEYYFITGRHASIVRKLDGKLQYLELQSAKNSGWHFFEGDDILYKGTEYEKTIHRTVSDTLTNRFACNRGTRYGYSYLLDIEQFKGSNEFRDLMGYVNTAEFKQQKGKLGSVK